MFVRAFCKFCGANRCKNGPALAVSKSRGSGRRGSAGGSGMSIIIINIPLKNDGNYNIIISMIMIIRSSLRLHRST